ncbi:MAG: polysaccharide deacetylase family protein [Tissierellia bacterium]|nr:polysaccharide deacetylase family protein [Tissierellia bacterium]
MKRLLLLVLILAFTGCGHDKDKTETNEEKIISENRDEKKIEENESNEKSAESNPNQNSSDKEVEETKSEDELIKNIDLSLNPNEAGKIMVLMYHNIGEPEDEWVRTPENFRKDLRYLHEKGYIPISLKDYVSGNIHTPAGKTPYVLTFDDSNENNFRYLADGSIDPDCAVGILLEFGKEYPDIIPYCSFFGNGEIPFRVTGQEREKINFLINNNMDVGNHTVNHPDLTSMSPDEVNYEVGHQAKYLNSLIDSDYVVNTIALPFGSRPEDPEAEAQIFKGIYDGMEYENIAVLNVGWDPYLSPYSKEFDAHAIHRIRASEMMVDGVGIYDWLEYFDHNPEERFISDGYSEIITIPSEYSDQIENKDGKELFIY